MALRTLLLLGLAFAGTACAEGFDFEALRTLIEARQVRSVEALLPLLPAGLRYRYALVFASRSLQGASYASPRVVLYGTDARLVLTFNGAPGQRGFGSIETLEFDEAARAFRLREIGFPADAAGAVTVSQVDPPRCTRCHGSPARPVWDTHPAWPGAYGERYGAALSPAERAGIDAFLAAQPAHPRYRHLLGAERFADPDTFRPDARSRYGGSPAEPPNAELSGLFGTLAARATVRELAAREGFAAYRYALLGASDLACGRLDDFFPAASARPVAAALRDFEAVTAAANAREREFKALRLGTGTPPSRPADDAALTPLRFLAESALGLRSRGWTLALEKGSYDFTLPPAAAGAVRRSRRSRRRSLRSPSSRPTRRRPTAIATATSCAAAAAPRSPGARRPARRCRRRRPRASSPPTGPPRSGCASRATSRTSRRRSPSPTRRSWRGRCGARHPAPAQASPCCCSGCRRRRARGACRSASTCRSRSARRSPPTSARSRRRRRRPRPPAATGRAARTPRAQRSTVTRIALRSCARAVSLKAAAHPAD